MFIPKFSRVLNFIALLIGCHLFGFASELQSGSYTINQDWSQEQDYERRYFVHVPDSEEPLPLFIFLHGNGGNAEKSESDGDPPHWVTETAARPRENFAVPSLVRVSVKPI